LAGSPVRPLVEADCELLVAWLEPENVGPELLPRADDEPEPELLPPAAADGRVEEDAAPVSSEPPSSLLPEDLVFWALVVVRLELELLCPLPPGRTAVSTVFVNPDDDPAGSGFT